MSERAAVGMQMSADGGEQEGRRHEPADPGMAVPDHVVHETPSQQLWSQPVQADATSEALRQHLWWGRSGEAGTPDEPLRWAQTEGVAAGKLADRPGWSYHSRVLSEWATPPANEGSRQWRIGAGGVTGGGRQNSATQFYVHVWPRQGHCQ